MSDHTITLSSQTYQRLMAIAQVQGVTPEQWIHSNLPQPVEEPESGLGVSGDEIDGEMVGSAYVELTSEEEMPPQASLTLLNGFVGIFDSAAHPISPHRKTDFGQVVARKLAQQGIQLP